MVKQYKYLGIWMKYNLSLSKHLLFLKRKSIYITTAFTSFRRNSKSIKFCHNMWVTFIRPLLDYSASYIRFCNEHDKKKMFTMHRTTLKAMLFLQNYVPNVFVDALIQYDYKELPFKFHQISELKWEERKKIQPNQDLLSEKVNFNYNKFDVSSIPFEIIEMMNIFYHRGYCKNCEMVKTPEHFDSHLRHKFGKDYINPVDLFYNLLALHNDISNLDVYTLYNQLVTSIR